MKRTKDYLERIVTTKVLGEEAKWLIVSIKGMRYKPKVLEESHKDYTKIYLGK